MKDFFRTKSIIPVIVFKDPFEVDDKLNALYKGGLKIAEITYRTPRSSEVLKYAIEKLGNKMTIGAGTVISKEQAEEAISFGAKFIVSPGLSIDVARVCEERNIPYLPGVSTASEIMMALNLGIKTVKFFPAEAMGGIKTIKALSSAFPQVKFVPTGGINETNIVSYLKEDYIASVGGSFMMKGTITDITKNTKKVLEDIKQLGVK